MANDASVAEVFRAWVVVQQAAQMLQAAVAARLAALGLDYPQAAVLTVLRVHGPQPIGSLARYLLARVGTMTALIDRLERAGLVRRISHPTDRRSWLVVLTEAGAVAAVAADTALADVAATTFGVVPDRDVRHVATRLSRVRDAVAPVAGIPPAEYAYATDTLALRRTPAA